MMQLSVATASSISLVSSVNPFLGVAGPIAAIIIGLYMVIFIILALAISALAAFLAYWVRNKAEVIKILRPTVDSVNKTTEAFQRGVAPADTGNELIRTIAQNAVRVQAVDQRVTQVSDRVVGSAIEFRARTMQVKAVVNAFLHPASSSSSAVVATSAGLAEQPGVDGNKLVEPTDAIKLSSLAPVGTDVSRPNEVSSQRNNVPVH